VSLGDSLYKILDKDGKISFSQYPPVTKSDNATIEDITVGSGPASTISEKLDGRYCGSIRLPEQSRSGSSKTNYLKSLQQSHDNCQRRLDVLDKNVDLADQNAIKYNENRRQQYRRSEQGMQNKGYQQSQAIHSEQLRDLRCALNWVERGVMALLTLLPRAEWSGTGCCKSDRI
jgi:hypothetical protein